MLATLKEVLEKAEQGNYAVGALTVLLWSLEWQLWKQQKSSIVQ